MIKKIYQGFLLVALVITGLNLLRPSSVQAEPSVTYVLRILATGDLHGKVTSYDCETYEQTPGASLGKLATLAGQARREGGESNTLLVDAGDFLSDYTSNYLYDNNKNLVQPIMKAMSLMGYDYITLGNHDFDYPWDYLNSQLKTSALFNKVVSSNVLWHDSGEPVFAPSAVKEMKLTAADGSTVSVRVGVVGSTTDSFSNRRGDYVNLMDAANNYDSIVKEADRLKYGKLADIVIVLLHGGIGSETSGRNSENIGYALTKVSSVDAVVTAHTHELFPDANSPYNALANTDAQTGCINGKPVLATSSHAQALGVIDLALSIAADGSVKIDNGKASIKKVSKETAEDPAVTTMFQDYINILKAGADQGSYKLSSGITYQNYDSVLQDSNLYQLLNNAKIDYGLTYVSQYLPDMKGVPVIACTKNLLDNNQFYISLKGDLTLAKISQILSESTAVRSSGYIQMYRITGEQLREWLEYSASIYASEGTAFTKLLQSYVSKNKGISTLLQEDYVYNQRNQYVFDGISYTIDLSKKARYTQDGKIISTNNKRISALTYNGRSITDSQNFILVTDSLSKILPFMPSDEASVKTVKDNETGKNITLNYIRKLSAFGSIAVTADHNWSLKAGADYTFLLGIPTNALETVSGYSWNTGLAAQTATYSFLKGRLPSVSQKVNILAAQGRTEMNNTPVPVVISASSKYAVQEIKYLKGKITKATDTRWSSAAPVKNNVFNVSENGIYTVLAKDSAGKASIAYVTVDRFDANVLPSPKPDRLTNRSTVFTGTALAGSVIYVSIGGNDYYAMVADNGTFRVTIKPQKAFSIINAYIRAGGKTSTVATASVRKTGPDAVIINPIHPGDRQVTGTADKHTLVYAMIWPSAYVGRGQSVAYIQSDFYYSL